MGEGGGGGGGGIVTQSQKEGMEQASYLLPFIFSPIIMAGVYFVKSMV